METFWMVYAVGGQAPKFRHKEERDAIKEATRIARLNDGEEVLVLRCTHRVAFNAVTVQELEYIPF